MSKATQTPEAEVAAATAPHKSYLIEKADESTGELRLESKFKYLAGRPKQYRFNGQTGQFNLNGTEYIGTSLSIQPITWRIFEENLFARGRKEEWAEILFVDNTDSVSAIMFSNSSVGRLLKLIEQLFYRDLSLNDVVLTIKSEAKKNDKGQYHVAVFEYKEADKAQVLELQEFAQDIPIYRTDTLTPTAVYSLVSPTFRIPELPSHDETALLADSSPGQQAA